METNIRSLSLTRRRMVTGIAGGLAGIFIAACGPSPTTPAPTTAPASAPTSAPTANQPAATAAPAKASQPVNFQSWWNPSESKPMDEWDKFVKKDFTDKNGGVQLNISYVPFGDYFKKFLASIAAGSAPDALHSSIVWGRDFYDLGTLIELNDYMKSSPDMNPQNLIPVTNLYNQKAGKYYGASWEGPDGDAIYYNVDLFQQAGIDPAYDKVKTWTWDDLIQNAQKLTKSQGSQLDVGGFLVSVLDVEFFSTWLYTNGAKFYADDVQSKVGFADNGRGAKVVQYHLDLLNKYKVSPALSPQRQDTNLFYQGKTAMYLAGLWAISKFQTDAPNLKFDLMPPVKGPDGKSASTAAFANMNTIPTKAQNKDGAWQFLMWYSSLDTTLAKLRIQGMPSPRKDFYETKEWKAAVVEVPQRARVPEIAALGDIYPFARYTRVNEVFDPAMQAMFIGNTPPEKGVADVQSKINEILPQTPQA